MEIFQIVGLGIIATIMIVILKDFRPEFIIFISIITGLIIFSLILNKLVYVVDVMKNLSLKANLEIEYFSIILKIIGMSYIVEFGSQICRDADQNSIAMKIELAGKVSIMILAIPILMSLMDLILKILP
ncbi:stage III sporulation protein AD [Tissierella creatinophila]|uniref:Stage III sporulation protein AC/AD protein family protein n=1 Tax=Tissierella creatinophila DSM 6911 TaxID=1123403 RepID=A0A1U7M9H3_TISCR|nr:stage III sporulation protein AD [Tissierella creatinophila]OLS03935.1 stage III sporulation protein AC/AD protein family protein [Tissierella creatinophila DSM 6911]